MLRVRLCFARSIALVLLAAVHAGAAPADVARAVIDASGVKGGLVVHIGCGDGTLTAALRPSDSFLVQGLDKDVVAARRTIQSAGLYGPVSAIAWNGKSLPYTDNLVNLLVISGPATVDQAEIDRVLCPNGVAIRLNAESEIQDPKYTKPRPPQIADWTHFLYSPSNNAVSPDSVVGPPKNLQWTAGPRWARHHDHVASVSAMVSAGGRIFWIMDEGLTASILTPAKWNLVARDAFSGVLLWRRPLESWHTHYWPNKSGPANLPRRLVADGDRLYVTPGISSPVVAIDGATGRTLQTYENTAKTEEILLADGVLYLVINEAPDRPQQPRSVFNDLLEMDDKGRKIPWDWQDKRIAAVDAASGKLMWERKSAVAPMTLAMDGRRVYWHDGQGVVAVAVADGADAWRSEPVGGVKELTTNAAPTLVVAGNTVLLTDKTLVAGIDAATGKLLWQDKHPASGYVAPADLMVINGLIWAGQTRDRGNSGEFVGRDPRTGEIRKKFPIDTKIDWFHRCYRAKATERFFMPSRTGIELVDLAEQHWIPNHWTRGGCIYGIMPANGLLYAPPSACSCYIQSRIIGFNALAPQRPAANAAPAEPLQRGPAYDAAITGQASPADWPTYRADALRSGGVAAAVPPSLKPAWTVNLGGRLSGVTVAGQRAFVARVDQHEVCAVDIDAGQVAWRFTAGGRVDSPPTIWDGRVMFGSADGWVYCLRAEDGALAWRYRAAPVQRQVMAFEQLESAWPVHGSVLVRDGQVWFIAGRSAFLDGGMRLVRLDARTGKLVGETNIDDSVPGTDQGLQSLVKMLDMPVAMPDILSADDQFVYLRGQKFDVQGQRPTLEQPDMKDQKGPGAHLFSPHGFLDDSWFSRSYWVYGKRYASGAGMFGRVGQEAVAGRIMVCNDQKVFSFGYQPPYYRWVSPVEYHLYRADKAPAIVPITVKDGMRNDSTIKSRPAWDWSVQLPLLVRAMALAGDTLFVAGPPDVVDEVYAYHNINDAERQAKLAEQDAAWLGRRGAELWAVSASDGKKIAAIKLDSPPVFDGMATARGRLFLVTMNGDVKCFDEAR